MSIAAMYRNWIPFARAFSYYDPDTMDLVTEYHIVHVKGNIQPFKSGLTIDIQQHITDLQSYRVVRTKKPITNLWDDVTIGEPGEYDYFYDVEVGRWFRVEGIENWRRPGRNPKHHKYIGRYTEQITDDIGEPTPMPELVDKFEAVVAELHNLIPAIT